ncbi:hypothetical protein M378DRAFT_21972 [Amanita muscaria Koide BX008]|uniref:DUF6697 domain-containing protein n=1 Tax=Amanita muscaria (strain Koide BX008) TaxID=946122 RepID=A0A0C2SY80_AMAMK|nr:hypothetical protein M378DRAFT_21972 [Amanita muscaria Koide BX008]
MSCISFLDEKEQDPLPKSDVHQSLFTLNDPFRVAEMAFELQIEKLRAIEALKARDVALQRLADAYTLLKQKTEQLDSIQSTNGETNVSTSSKQADVNYMGVAVKMLREESQTFKDLTNNLEPPPSYEAELGKGSTPPANASPTFLSDLKADNASESRIIYATPGSDEPSEMVHARYALLAGIPVPPDAPEDTLRPIIIPPPITLSEFINTMSGPLRTSLLNYRILHGATTIWCPEREEHGYFYAPRFKCNTNPRVVTANRWSQVDVISPMNKPTECFFSKDGAWYYAGIYKGFAMDDLTAKEWAHLSPETTQAIIKETLSGRKNTSPQNVYETGQLYAAGALKVACVGLQCVGFNQAMYKALLEHAGRFAQNKTKTLSGHGIGPTGSSSPRAHWNSSCRSPKE